jgi:hypothetical protein
MNHIKLATSIEKFSTNLHNNFQLSPNPETGTTLAVTCPYFWIRENLFEAYTNKLEI